MTFSNTVINSETTKAYDKFYKPVYNDNAEQ